MSKPVIFLDIDGCIASQGKIWHEQEVRFTSGEFGQGSRDTKKILSVSKVISDHDSWAIDTFKKQADIVIISGDERINKAWAERRDVPFIFTCAAGFHQDKWQFLTDYWYENFDVGPEGNYYYLGDCMPDYKCMVHAEQSFYPADAAECLVSKLCKRMDSHQLNTKSSQGCFEEMCWRLVNDGVLTYE